MMSWTVFSRLLENRFFRRISTLFSGSVVTNVIALVGFMGLTRLYSIETLGRYYVFASFAQITQVLLCMGYLGAVPLADDDEMPRLIQGMFFIAILLLMGLSPLAFWAQLPLLIAAHALFTTHYQISEQLLVREQRIRPLAVIKVANVSVSYLCSGLAFGLFGDHLVVLAGAQVVAIGGLNVFLYFWISRRYRWLSVQRAHLIVLKKYKKFPAYIGPAQVLLTLSARIPILVAGGWFSPAVAANYNMAFRLVYQPGGMVAGAVAQVYTAHLSRHFRAEEGDLFRGYGRLKRWLFFFCILYFLGVLLVVPPFIAYFFDEKWSGSVELSVALLPLVVSTLFVAPLSHLFQFTGHQKHVFQIALASVTLSAGSFGFAVWSGDFLSGVWIFSILMSIRYGFIFLRINQLEGERDRALSDGPD